MSHTPTPWHLGERHPGRILATQEWPDMGSFVSRQTTAFVATVCNHSDDEDSPNEQESANAAYIIKAANAYPELVACLRATYGELARHLSPTSQLMGSCAKARALLAELEGKA